MTIFLAVWIHYNIAPVLSLFMGVGGERGHALSVIFVAFVTNKTPQYTTHDHLLPLWIPYNIALMLFLLGEREGRIGLICKMCPKI